MRSLFLKIFLSFWVATALFIVLAILVTLAMRPTDGRGRRFLPLDIAPGAPAVKEAE